MRQSTLLIVNTAATYVRMLITVGLGLLVTRLLLRDLGQEQFGVYNAILASVLTIFLLNDALNSSGDRHLAFEVGRGDRASVARFFSVYFFMFLGLAGLLLAGGLPLVGLLATSLKVPVGMDADVALCFGLIMGTSALTAITIPFRSMITAHQRMVVLTAVELLDSLLRLGVVLLLVVVTEQRFEAFCAMVLASQAIVLVVVAGYCMAKFPEARPKPALVDHATFKTLGSYAFWVIFGIASLRIRMQGPQIALNQFFGPAANAAYALANQLAGYQSNLGSALYRAVLPALIGMEARNDRARVHEMVVLVSRYMVLLTYFFLVPLQLELETVLRLWLGSGYPELAPSLIRLVLAWSAVLWLTMGYQAAIQSTGRVAAYMVILFVGDALCMGVSLLVLTLTDAPAWVIPAICLGYMVLFTIFHALYVGRRIELPAMVWVRRTVLPVLAVGIPATLVALLPRLLMDEGVVRVVVVTGVFGVANSVFAWMFGMSKVERGHFIRVGKSIAQRIGLVRSAKN